jgi:hypothetical protein
MGCCRNRAAVLMAGIFVGLSSFVSVAAQGAPPLARGVIGRLTAETREEALQCGRAGADCAVRPYELCPAGQYVATLITPFSRVAVAAMEAQREGRPLGRMGAGAVNRWGAAILVSPAPHVSNPAAIARVEIRRDGRLLQPARVTVGPITTALPDGSTRQSTRGIFTFSADSFEPSTEIHVVFTGSPGESVCSLDRARLAALR